MCRLVVVTSVGEFPYVGLMISLSQLSSKRAERRPDFSVLQSGHKSEPFKGRLFPNANILLAHLFDD